MFLLDTNIISFLMREGEKKESIIKYINNNPNSALFISTITYYEIESGIHRAKLRYGNEYKSQQFNAIRAMINSEVILKINFTQEIAIQAAYIKAVLLSEGVTLSEPDVFIASTAITHDLTLITNNMKDFSQISSKFKLKTEDWTSI